MNEKTEALLVALQIVGYQVKTDNGSLLMDNKSYLLMIRERFAMFVENGALRQVPIEEIEKFLIDLL